MSDMEQRTAKVLLEDGTLFIGRAAGVVGTATGEICFNTGMTGYQEIFTDPSYYGQILVAATSHIGNYGIKEDEVESDSVKIAGFICKKFSEIFSREAADESLQSYFERDNIVAVCEVDTRAIVRHIRDKGAMNVIISSEDKTIDELKEELAKVPSMEGLELSSKVTTSKSYEMNNGSDSKFKVAVLDIGVKKNILRNLVQRGCHVKVFPMDTSFEEMMSWEPDGFMLSNGPGDPSALPGVIETVKKITDSEIPAFGICLGHQVLSLSLGLSTFKMHNGHRGINHPVKNLRTGKCEVTSQNHGFVVNMEEAEANENIEVTHVHLNDGTLAGIRHKSKPVFSVQYHPEASPGPHDASYLFDEFIEKMVSTKEQIVQ